MYLDANVFIHAEFEPGKRGQTARKILSTKAITSVHTVQEVLNGSRKISRVAPRPIIEAMYALNTLTIVDVKKISGRRALDLAEIHNLKAGDALHLAIMEELGETKILSDDKDFDGIAGITRVPLQ